MERVTPDVWHALRLAEFAEAGAWPVAGGVNDQCAQFVRFVEHVRQTDTRLKPEDVMLVVARMLTAR